MDTTTWLTLILVEHRVISLAVEILKQFGEALDSKVKHS